MKTLIIYLTFQILTLSLFGQLNSVDKSFISNILKHEPGSDTITYVDRVKPISIPSFSKIFEKGKIFCFEISTQKRIEFILLPEEKNQLRTELKLIRKIKWADSLFPNSRSIRSDSMWGYISKRNREFSKIYVSKVEQGNANNTSNPNRASFCSVFQFSRPIFLRKNTIAIFYFLRLCGTECGIEDLSIYRLQGSQYRRWLIIKGVAF